MLLSRVGRYVSLGAVLIAPQLVFVGCSNESGQPQKADTAPAAQTPETAEAKPPPEPEATIACRELSAAICDPFKTDEEDPQKINKQAFRARKKGESDKAVCLAQEVVTRATDPELLGRAYYELFANWKERDNSDLAYQCILKSIEVRPKDTEGYRISCIDCADLHKGGCGKCDEAASRSGDGKSRLLELPDGTPFIIWRQLDWSAQRPQGGVLAANEFWDVDIDGDGKDEQLKIGNGSPNGTEVTAIFGDQGYNIFYDVEIPGDDSAWFEEDGLRQKFYMQVALVDFDEDRKPEVLIAFGDGLGGPVGLGVVKYTGKRAGPTKSPFRSIGSFRGKGRIKIDGSRKIVVRKGEESVEYEFRNGKFVKETRL